VDNASTLPKVSVYPLIGIGIVAGLFAAMFGIGGGGVIVPEEIKELEAYGVAKIYSPEDGARMGLQGLGEGSGSAGIGGGGHGRGPLQQRVHRIGVGAAGHGGHGGGGHGGVGENRRPGPQGVDAGSTGPGAEAQLAGQAEIAAAVHQALQHVLLVGLQAGIA
jgi:hypothetical protein